MPLNTTPRSIQLRAAEELALKLSLEGPVSSQFDRLFKTIAKDFEAVLVQTGNPLNAGFYTDDVRQILAPLYRTASIEVSRTARDGIKSQWIDMELKQALDVDEFDNETIALLIAEALRKFNAEQVIDRSSKIINTTNDQLNEAIINVTADAAALGQTLTDAQLAEAAAAEFLVLSAPRPDRIAETETLNAVEGSKAIEVGMMTQAGATIRGVPIAQVTIRQWLTLGDKLVRATHNDADGQQVKTGEAFQVGQSLLRWPGDTGLGAALKEIINCRCGAFTVINESALALAA